MIKLKKKMIVVHFWKNEIEMKSLGNAYVYENH